MEDTKQGPNIGRGVLQAIFAVFLGLMITAVVGVGVYTFHPNPGEDDPGADPGALRRAVRDRRLQHADAGAVPGLGPADGRRAGPDEGHRRRGDDAAARVPRSSASQWRMSTSVILIVIATILMAVALALGDSVAVLSNGILLGGLFTMLYGVGWGLASGNSVTRFVVLVVALVVSLALGYLKFVRGRGPAGAAQVSGASSGGVGPGGGRRVGGGGRAQLPG